MKLISIGDAARLCGVARCTLRNWERKGYLTPHYTPGGHRRYAAEELQKRMNDDWSEEKEKRRSYFGRENK